MAALRIPDALAEQLPVRGGAAGTEWLRTLPERLARVSQRWNLDVGDPIEPGGIWALVLPTSRGILKLSAPNAHAQYEVAALSAWHGDGSVRVYEYDEEESALLLEQCVPGTALEGERDLARRDSIVAELLPRLWSHVTPSRIPPIDVAGRVALLEAQRHHFSSEDRSLVDEAMQEFDQLVESTAVEVLLHGDLHPQNVLRAAREEWLVIDPLAAVGDPAYDLVRWFSFRHGEVFAPQRHADPRSEWFRQIDALGLAVDVDPDRVRRWMFCTFIEAAVLNGMWQGASKPHFDAARVLKCSATR